MISLLLKDIVQSEKRAIQSTASLHQVVDLMNANKWVVGILCDGEKPGRLY